LPQYRTAGSQQTLEKHLQREVFFHFSMIRTGLSGFLGNRRRAKGGRSPSLSGNGGRISGESGGMAASIALSHPTETGKSLANARFFRQLGVPVQLPFRRPFKLG
jgi:hypothetical protein